MHLECSYGKHYSRKSNLSELLVRLPRQGESET